jgi:hypothetical protein
MTDVTEPAPSYLSRVFLVQYNLILLGGAALFALAAATPWPLIAAAALEALWLGLGASLPEMRLWLDRREASFRRAEAERTVGTAAQGLDPEYAERVRGMQGALAEIREAGGRAPSAVFEQAVARLETLGPVYVELCVTHQRLGRFLLGTTEAELSLEAERLKASFSAEKDLGIRLTLRQALALAQRRSEHRQAMLQLFRSLGVKLETVERSVAYLRSQGPALTSNPSLTDEIEALLAETGPALAQDVTQDASLGLAPA